MRFAVVCRGPWRISVQLDVVMAKNDDDDADDPIQKAIPSGLFSWIFQLQATTAVVVVNDCKYGYVMMMMTIKVYF